MVMGARSEGGARTANSTHHACPRRTKALFPARLRQLALERGAFSESGDSFGSSSDSGGGAGEGGGVSRIGIVKFLRAWERRAACEAGPPIRL